MNKFSLLLFTVMFALSACKQNFKKGDKGLEYKIIANGSGLTVKPGNFMQMHICQFTNDGKKDTILNDTRTAGSPVIEPFDNTSVPPEYYKILAQMRKGDSLIIRVPVDSLLAKNMGTLPPFFKKGQYFTTTVSLIDIFKSREQADSASRVAMEIAMKKDSIDNVAQMFKDDKILQDYFKKNNIKTIKGALGTYVEIIQPGTGNKIDTSVVVRTNYTGRTMSGKMFDSNTDPSKGHVEPYDVNLTSDRTLGGSVIKGWQDGLTMLSKGAKAKFYIPSPLAYGKQQAGEDIAPNSILIFDIEIVDVLTKSQAKLATEKKMKEMQAKQKHYMDSIAKARPDTSKVSAKK